eukprot:jgi/Botrbrau1/19980/Bobra.0059s0094.1
MLAGGRCRLPEPHRGGPEGQVAQSGEGEDGAQSCPAPGTFLGAGGSTQGWTCWRISSTLRGPTATYATTRPRRRVPCGTPPWGLGLSKGARKAKKRFYSQKCPEEEETGISRTCLKGRQGRGEFLGPLGPLVGTRACSMARWGTRACSMAWWGTRACSMAMWGRRACSIVPVGGTSACLMSRCRTRACSMGTQAEKARWCRSVLGDQDWASRQRRLELLKTARAAGTSPGTTGLAGVSEELPAVAESGDSLDGAQAGAVVEYRGRPPSPGRQPHLGVQGALTKRRRKAHRWTPEETHLLTRLVDAHGVGKWKSIKEAGGAAFEYRTEVDLKDKWRNLNRHSTGK